MTTGDRITVADNVGDTVHIKILEINMNINIRKKSVVLAL